jgi:REP element-mobilizing transposase RayT
MNSAAPCSGERERAEDCASSIRSGECERADSARKGYLPRLPREYYAGRAFIHWTLTIEGCAQGWLTSKFREQWNFVLLHACARFDLAVPAYVLMPDHTHLLMVGLDDEADHLTAIEFLRRHLAPALEPAGWQKQAHDHVLKEFERKEGAFQTIAQYVLENPVRGGLASDWREYPYVGCCVAGYPNLNLASDGYWPLFWRIYYKRVTQASARSRSPLLSP